MEIATAKAEATTRQKPQQGQSHYKAEATTRAKPLQGRSHYKDRATKLTHKHTHTALSTPPVTWQHDINTCMCMCAHVFVRACISACMCVYVCMHMCVACT